MKENETSLSRKLNYLFETKTKPNGKPYTYQEVSDATGLATSYLWKLRHGESESPRKDTVAALAKFFDVEPSYFQDDAPLNQTITEPYILEIAARAQQLTMKGRSVLLNMLNQLLELETAKKEQDKE